MAGKIIDVSTDTSEVYKFYPVTSGSLQFQLKAEKQGHICLTNQPNEKGKDFIEVFLAREKRIALRTNRNNYYSAQLYNENILSRKEFRGFWIRWAKGVIRVGLEGATTALLVWEDPTPFTISYFGVRTHGVTGIWKIEGMKEIRTSETTDYKLFQPVLAGSVEFEVRAANDAQVALTNSPDEKNDYCQVIVGYSKNTETIIRFIRKQTVNMECQVAAKTPNIISEKCFKKIIIEWRRGFVKVRQEMDKDVLEWTDPWEQLNPITHFGVRTINNATGDWRISTI